MAEGEPIRIDSENFQNSPSESAEQPKLFQSEEQVKPPALASAMVGQRRRFATYRRLTGR